MTDFSITDHILCVDFETASAADIRNGAWAYSLHPSTRVYCVVGIFGDDATNLRLVNWSPEEGECPPEIRQWVEGGGRVLAHNVGFERAIWDNILGPRFDWPVPDALQWVDTQAMAAACALPTSLEGLCDVLGSPIQKDVEGARLMKRMAVAHQDPHMPLMGEAGGEGFYYPHETPENLERLRAYCTQDVAATLAAYRQMPTLSVTEMLVWQTDQKINQRGVLVDLELVRAMADTAKKRVEALRDEVVDLTLGELKSSTAHQRLRAWMVSRQVEPPKSLDRENVQELLAHGDLPGDVRAVLENRLEATRETSLKKLDRVEHMLGPDLRLRGAFEYGGAHTGRWSSRGLQLHNMPKCKLSKDEVAIALEAVKHRDVEALGWVGDRPLEVISQMLRMVLVAPPDREFIAGDYSAIEARVLAWLAGQDDILQVFETGGDVYVHAAESIGSNDRQLGKVATLALGYGMGDAKFSVTAGRWGMALPYGEARRIRKQWRMANHRIVDFWAEVEDAAMRCVDRPAVSVGVGPLTFYFTKGVLMVMLPSKRVLRYYRPHIVEELREIQVVNEAGELETIEMETRGLCYFTAGRDRKTMTRQHTYGGKLVENITQAVARDLLAEALLRLEQHDTYTPVLHVHDSVVSEVPTGTGHVVEFESLMARQPSWAEGLPLAVEGYRDRRFHG